MKMRRMLVTGLLLGTLGIAVPGYAQEEGGGAGRMRGQFANMPRVSGEVTAVSGATVTVKTEDGSVAQIVTTDNTILRKGTAAMRSPMDAQPIKLADLKPGDGVMAIGQMDDSSKTLHAAMMFATDAAVVKALKENLGKTYIAGKVTAIDLDNAKLTVQRPDGVAQVIGLDENTSFKRGRGRGGMGGGMNGGGAGAGAPAAGGESITLADVKVGDQVTGQGALKGGTFVPTELHVMTPRPRPQQ